MPYSTQSDIETDIGSARVQQLTDDNKTLATNPAIVAWAIASADALIDAYIGARYTLPLATPTPGIIKKLSAQLAIYFLFARRLEYSENDAVRSRYKDAIEELKRIADGTTILPGITTEPTAPSGPVYVKSHEAIFGRDLLKKM